MSIVAYQRVCRSPDCTQKIHILYTAINTVNDNICNTQLGYFIDIIILVRKHQHNYKSREYFHGVRVTYCILFIAKKGNKNFNLIVYQYL